MNVDVALEKREPWVLFIVNQLYWLLQSLDCVSLFLCCA